MGNVTVMCVGGRSTSARSATRWWLGPTALRCSMCAARTERWSPLFLAAHVDGEGRGVWNWMCWESPGGVDFRSLMLRPWGCGFLPSDRLSSSVFAHRHVPFFKKYAPLERHRDVSRRGVRLHAGDHGRRPPAGDCLTPRSTPTANAGGLCTGPRAGIGKVVDETAVVRSHGRGPLDRGHSAMPIGI